MGLLLRNSITNGKRYGFATAIGLTIGDILHILLIVLGLTSILLTEIISFGTFKILISIYLIYLGYTTIKSQNNTISIHENKIYNDTKKRSFVEGFLTSVTNLSVLLFVSNMLIIIMRDSITVYEFSCWGLLLTSMTLSWLFLVVAISSSVKFKKNIKIVIQKIIGFLLVLYRSKYLLFYLNVKNIFLVN